MSGWRMTGAGLLALAIGAGCGAPAEVVELPSDALGGALNDYGGLFESDGIGGGGAFAVFIGDFGLVTGDAVPLPGLLPGAEAKARLRVQIANLGQQDIQVLGMAVLDQNEDGSPANRYVSLVFPQGGGGGPFPATLGPHGQDRAAFVEAELVFAPLGADSNAATLAIEVAGAVNGTRRLRLVPPSYAPNIRAMPREIFFWQADIDSPETQAIEIHNDGLLPLEITGAVIDDKTAPFTLVEASIEGVVAPKGSPGYAPLVFHVTNVPVFGANNEKAHVVIASNDPDEAGLKVPLESMYGTSAAQSPCVWEKPQDEILDFSDTLAGTKTLSLTLSNVGQGVCTVTRAEAVADLEGHHYTVEAVVSDGTGSAELPRSTWPAIVQAGQTLRLDVIYVAGDAGFDTKVVVEYRDPLPRSFELQAKGGPNKPCLRFVPAPGGAPMALQFVGAPGSQVNRQFVVQSCGQGTLTIDTVTITDNLNPSVPSALWSIPTPGSEHIVVPAGESQPFALSMTLPQVAGAEVSGSMNLSWLSGTKRETTTVALSGVADGSLIAPVSVPGSAGDYAKFKVGEALLLDGSQSTPGPGGSLVDIQGYLWALVARPAGSAMTLDEAWSGPTRFVIPDVPGAYRFGLVVRTGDSPPLVSGLSVVELTAQ